jgi:antitoxin (DNA-binding transcriptional repressor) of toxin-antitoxin stability system
MEATTKDLRLHTAELLAAADRGESVIITYRGRRRAVIRRWSEAEKSSGVRGPNPAFGIWADRDEDVGQQLRSLRQRRNLP